MSKLKELQNQYQGLPKGSLMILQCTVGSTIHGTSVAGTELALNEESLDQALLAEEGPLAASGYAAA